MVDPDGPPHDLGRLIEVLDRYGVEYLMVGGVAAIGYGAERPTEDADCEVRRERANLDRLADALRELHARLRVGGMTDDEARQLPVKVDASMLQGMEITTWMTDAGGFDVLPGLAAEDGHIIPFEELVTRETVIPLQRSHNSSGFARGHHHCQGTRRPTEGSRGAARAPRASG